MMLCVWNGCPVLLVLLALSVSTAVGRNQGCGHSPVFANFRRPKFGPSLFTSPDTAPDLHNSARIINGLMSKRGAWPWQVSIQLSSPRLGLIGHWCGGVLLSPRWLVTAAHCVSNKLVEVLGGGIWTAVLGDWDRSSISGREQTMVVDQVLVHPNFTDYNNDIAMLHLPRRAPPSLVPVCLPPSLQTRGATVDDFLGLRCIATGWGQTMRNGTLESRLHQVNMRVVSNLDCGVVYGLQYSIPISPGHMCAGPDSRQQTGTCVGDSGGPLQCNLKDGRWYLAGITSFGSGCAKPGFPDVFVRVTEYVDWIRSVLRQEEMPR